MDQWRSQRSKSYLYLYFRIAGEACQKDGVGVEWWRIKLKKALLTGEKMGILEFKHYINQRPEAVSNDTILLAILNDAMCNDQKKYRALVSAHKAGIWDAIKANNPPSDDEKNRIILDLQANHGLVKQAAEFAVDFWIQSFDGFSFDSINGIFSYMGLPIPDKADLLSPGPQLVKISYNAALRGLSLQWTRQQNAGSYEIWRSVDEQKASIIEQGTFALPRFMDKDISAGKLYSYVVRSKIKDSGKPSMFSNVLQIAVPQDNADFEVGDVRVTNDGIQLMWTYQAGATEYLLKITDPFSEKTEKIIKIPNSQFTFTDNEISVENPHSYVLECERRDGPSLISKEITLTV